MIPYIALGIITIMVILYMLSITKSPTKQTHELTKIEIQEELFQAWEHLETVRIMGLNLPRSSDQITINQEIEKIQLSIKATQVAYKLPGNDPEIKSIFGDKSQAPPTKQTHKEYIRQNYREDKIINPELLSNSQP